MLAAWRRSGRASSAPDGELRADDQVGPARLEDVDGAPVEVGVAEVDFLADDELAARHQNALLHGLAVVRLAEAHHLDSPSAGSVYFAASSSAISTVRSFEPFSARMIS